MNRTFDNFGADAHWRNSNLAPQQKLGLRSQWRLGLAGSYHHRAVVDGPAVMGDCPERPGRSDHVRLSR